ncbi:hypothetical protein TNCV_3016491 [Trichonephila clavipes]|nr:hypothetical protein TNCV_3016491 [Trichonephila clavipes]
MPIKSVMHAKSAKAQSIWEPSVKLEECGSKLGAMFLLAHAKQSVPQAMTRRDLFQRRSAASESFVHVSSIRQVPKCESHSMVTPSSGGLATEF